MPDIWCLAHNSPSNVKYKNSIGSDKGTIKRETMMNGEQRIACPPSYKGAWLYTNRLPLPTKMLAPDALIYDQ